MNPFSYLLLGHFVGDFLFQTSWMAANKHTKWSALVVHSAVYTFFILSASFWGELALPWWFFVVVFLSHVVLDRKFFIVWWMKTVMRTKDTDVPWLAIVVDQVLHLLVIGALLHVVGS